jgi:ankyrin repeat protein
MYSKHIHFAILFFLFLVTGFPQVFSMEKEENWKSTQLILDTDKADISKENTSANTLFKNDHSNRYATLWIRRLPSEITREIIKKLIDFRSEEEIEKSAKAIANLSKTNRAFNSILNDSSVMQILLNSVHVSSYALSLAEFFKNMRVMKCPEMITWYKREKEKIENAEKLFWEIPGGNKARIQELLKSKNIDLDWIHKKYNVSILMNVINSFLAMSDRMEIVRMLLEAGANSNTANGDGQTPLILAVQNNTVEIVRLLLAKNDNTSINNKDNYGNTALWYSIGNPQLVKILIAAGANPNLGSDRYSKGNICWAIRQADVETVTLLLKSGAKVNCDDKNDFTPLVVAIFEGNEDAVRVLINSHASVNQADKNGQHALMWASRNGNKKIVRMLIDAGADVTLQDENGNDALKIANFNGHVEVAEILKQAQIIELQKKSY